MKEKKLIFNFFVNRNWKKLTDSRKRAKVLALNRKSQHPIETLFFSFFVYLFIVVCSFYKSHMIATLCMFFEAFFSGFQVFRHCLLKVAIITIEYI